MRERALLISTFREIRQSLPRFLSILFMITLGAFVFVGLFAIGPTMERTLYSYAQKYDMADVTVRHPLGLDHKDQQLLKDLPNVAAISFSYEADQVVGATGDVLRLQSSTDFPRYDIRDGRMPTHPREIALDFSLANRYRIGDTIYLDSGGKDQDAPLADDAYSIVGFVASTEHMEVGVRTELSMVGDGTVDGFGILLPEAFTIDDPALARLKFTDTAQLPPDSAAYRTAAADHMYTVETLLRLRPAARYDDFDTYARDSIDQGQRALDDASRQLDDSYTTLLNAQKDITNGFNALSDGQKALSDGTRYGQEQIQSAADTLDATRKTFTAAADDIRTGEAKLRDAEQLLQNNKRLLASGENDYSAGLARYEAAQRELSAGNETLRTAKTELDAARRQLADGEAQYARGQEEIAAARRQLDTARSQYDAARDTYTNGGARIQSAEAELSAGKVTLDQNKIKLDALTTTVASLQIQYDNAVASLPPGAPLPPDVSYLATQLAQAKAGYDQGYAAWQAGMQTYAASRAALDTQKAAYAQSGATLAAAAEKIRTGEAALVTHTESLHAARLTAEDGRRTFLAAEEKYNAGLRESDAAAKSLALAKTELDRSRRTLDDSAAAVRVGQNQLIANKAKLARARDALRQGQYQWQSGLESLQAARQNLATQNAIGQAELARNLDTLIAAQQEYLQGLKNFDTARPDALSDIGDGRQDLEDAREDLLRLSVPRYEIKTRALDSSFAEYMNYAAGIRQMAYFFPVFFYLIALLVCLTTMTRMVDDQRTQIGTLKALGYTNGAIIFKFVLYGALAAIIGSVLGIVLGGAVLVPVIWQSYSSTYVFTAPEIIIDPWIPLAALVIDLLCTAYAAYLSAKRSLTDNVASLLRPKAPPGGNRILLERIRPLWSRLGFHQKITARNLFRYKKRMSMTIIGVAGCMALITMGLGLNYSIAGIFPLQFGTLNHYDAVVIYDSNASDRSIDDYYQQLQSEPALQSHTAARYDTATLRLADGREQTLSLVAPVDPSAFGDMVLLRSADDGTPLHVQDGPIISQKAAYLYQLEIGDTLPFEDDDGNEKEVTIAGICENYTGHYLYLSADDYQHLTGKPLKANSDYLVLSDKDQAGTFAKNMLTNDITLRVMTTTTTSSIVDSLIASMKAVVSVVIFASVLLALIVLYNLTNINVEERLRELSTIKVLGFFPREVTAYIYRETFLLTVLGILLGAVLGKLLHTYICNVLAPPDFIMLTVIHPSTYAAAAAFTFLVSVFVMVIMHRKLERINMVEALKGVE